MNKYKFSALILLIFSTLILSCDNGDDDDDIETEFGAVFVTSNLSPVVGIYDFSDEDDVNLVQFGIASADADGIAYNSESDQLFVASRSNNRVEVYSDLAETQINANLDLSFSSTSDFSNARKLALSGDKLLIAQDAGDDNGQQNRFFVYTLSDNSATLSNTYDPQINLWDVQFAGNTLYAVEDNSDTLAVFNNLLSNSDGVVTASQKVQVADIVRTHALYYSSESDIMFMSDIGDANSGTDGAIHIIQNFSAKLSAAGSNGSIAVNDQIIIEGSNTQLGNPVGLAYDSDTQKIYVAERKVEGGKLLAFDLPTASGNLAPSFSQNFSGAAAVYLAD